MSGFIVNQLAATPSRKALLVLSLFSSAALAFARPTPQDAKATFQEAVDLLERGRNDEALVGFQKVLNAGISEDQAYEIFSLTGSSTWLDMLRQGGEMELVARRLMALASAGRRAHRDNAEAIKAQLANVDSDDVAARRSAIRTLSADHGAFAVPYMLPALADQGNDDRRVAVITALASMDTSVVPPLLSALESSDAFLRRNVAFALGHIRDPRANGTLAAHAAGDSDPAVREAAQQALQAIGQGVRPDQALATLLEEGQGYALRSPRLLADYQISDVVWSWDGNGLVSTPIPRDLYADELARASFHRALALDPGSLGARAGIARAAASQHARAEALRAAGEDTAALDGLLLSGAIAANGAGSAAIDAALDACLQQNDFGAAGVLARWLSGSGASPALTKALGAADARVRGEAAIALAMRRGSGAVDGRVLAELSEAAGREVLRIALVIDGDAARAASLAGALEAKGWLTASANSGATGLAMLHRLAGMDAVLVAESLPDMTTQQVLAEMRLEARTEKTPALLISANPEAAQEIYGDTVQGMLKGGEDLAALESAVAGQVDGDRAQADALARRAALAVAHLGAQGIDVGATRDALHRALSRPDEVASAACAALSSAGDASSAAALAALAADAARSNELRTAAGTAAADILGRVGAELGETERTALHAILGGDAPSELKLAVARALGSSNLSAADRAKLLEGARAKPGTP